MNERQIFQINKRSFLTIVIILLFLIVLALILALTLQKGIYVNDIYTEVNTNVSLWRLVLSPILVLTSSAAPIIIVISVFILILGGSFNLMDKTGGIEAILNYFIHRFATKKMLLMHLIVLLFMSLGAFFGIFEEAVTLMPMVILLALSLGWDTFTGVGMSLIAVGFGFSSAITNPFTIGLGSAEMGLLVIEGIIYRIFVFIILYIILCLYLRIHIRKIEKNPQSSLTYEDDVKKRLNLQLDITIKPLTLKVYTFFFIFILLVMFGATSLPALQKYTIPLIALGFLIGSFVCARILHYRFKGTLKVFFDGLKTMLPAILLILLAASIKFILEEGLVLDTIVNELSLLFTSSSKFKAILFIYLLILVVQFFIGSASAKIPLIIPIISKLALQVGITKNIALLAFIFGDGFTDLIYPTNPVLLIALGLAGISYPKWFKKTWFLQLALLIITCIILYIAFIIGY